MGGMWILGEDGEYLQVRSSYRGTFLSRAGARGARGGITREPWDFSSAKTVMMTGSTCADALI